MQHKACLVGLNRLYPSASNYSLWAQHPWWSLSPSFCLTVSPFFLFLLLSPKGCADCSMNLHDQEGGSEYAGASVCVCAVPALEDVFSWQNKYGNQPGCNAFSINLANLMHCFKIAHLLAGKKTKRRPMNMISAHDTEWDGCPEAAEWQMWRADRLDDLSWTSAARSAQNKRPSRGCGETRSFYECSPYLQRCITADLQRMTGGFAWSPAALSMFPPGHPVHSFLSSWTWVLLLADDQKMCFFLSWFLFFLNVNFKRALWHQFMT